MLEISVLSVEGFRPDLHTKGTMAYVYHEK